MACGRSGLATARNRAADNQRTKFERALRIAHEKPEQSVMRRRDTVVIFVAAAGYNNEIGVTLRQQSAHRRDSAAAREDVCS